MKERYEKTKEKIKALKSKNYKVIEVWQHELENRSGKEIAQKIKRMMKN